MKVSRRSPRQRFQRLRRDVSSFSISGNHSEIGRALKNASATFALAAKHESTAIDQLATRGRGEEKLEAWIRSRTKFAAVSATSSRRICATGCDALHRRETERVRRRRDRCGQRGAISIPVSAGAGCARTRPSFLFGHLLDDRARRVSIVDRSRLHDRGAKKRLDRAGELALHLESKSSAQ